MLPILALLCAGCAHERAVVESTPSPAGHPSAEAALEALATSWRARSTPAVVELFAPSRRALARDNLNVVEAEVVTWTPRSWSVDARCHGLDPSLTMARLSLDPRADLTRMRPAEPHEEVVWLIFEQERWWVYSL